MGNDLFLNYGLENEWMNYSFNEWMGNDLFSNWDLFIYFRRIGLILMIQKTFDNQM